MQARTKKTTTEKKPIQYAVLASGTASGYWVKEETSAPKRTNHIKLTSEPSSRLAKAFNT